MPATFNKYNFYLCRRTTMIIEGGKWITREKDKVDRIACPWLIRKFVDSKSEFLFPKGVWQDFKVYLKSN
jgi:Chromate resistance exported protein